MFEFPPPQLLVANGALLSVSGGGTRALSIATDEDWRVALNWARIRHAARAAQIERGQTWESSLSAWAAVFLTRKGKGRTGDGEDWNAQSPRWVEMVFEAADAGSLHHEIGFQQLGVANPTFALTREELLVDGAEDEATPFVPAFRPTGLVMTWKGELPLSKVRRSRRPGAGSEPPLESGERDGVVTLPGPFEGVRVKPTSTVRRRSG